MARYNVFEERDKALADAAICPNIRMRISLGTYSSGDQGNSEVAEDIKRFTRDISPATKGPDVRTGLIAYRELLRALLDLHQDAVLANHDEGYAASVRDEGFGNNGQAAMGHVVLIPHSAGGILRTTTIANYGQSDGLFATNLLVGYGCTYETDLQGFAVVESDGTSPRMFDVGGACDALMGFAERRVIAVWKAQLGIMTPS